MDIVGLDPRLFEICKSSKQSLIQSRSKERSVSTTDTSDLDYSSNPELANIPKDQLALYVKIASIIVDFERAYGRSVAIRVFSRSSNRFLNRLLRPRSLSSSSISASGSSLSPTFYVNGVKVFTGVPNSFSELDEAIDNAFRHEQKAT